MEELGCDIIFLTPPVSSGRLGFTFGKGDCLERPQAQHSTWFLCPVSHVNLRGRNEALVPLPLAMASRAAGNRKKNIMKRPILRLEEELT
jgi:hypothetical protein